ncbi:MAG: UvrD-helicase domain-containing protein [Rhodospirillales bacterium]
MEGLLLHRDDPVDPDEPQRGASDPGASVWVAASAGTGKTKVLSDRVLLLMLSGTEPRRILCLTYTRAAAAEMANRIAQRLGEWATADDDALKKALLKLLGAEATDRQLHRARTLFAMVLDAPGGLGIQTIHAFCQSLLGRFPLEAEIAPHAQPMDEREATDLRQRALQDILGEAGRSGGPLAEALAGIVRHLREFRFGEIMAEIGKKPGRFEAMIAAHGSLPAAIDAVPALLSLAPGETAESIIAAGCGDDACDIPALRRAAAALVCGSSDGECGRAARMHTWLEGDAQARSETFDEWAGIFLTDLAKQPRVKEAKSLVTKATEERFPGTLAAMSAEAERLACLLPRRNAAITCEATTALMVVGAALLHRYRSLKQNRALLDYEDLIDGARRLLQSTEGDWVLYKLDGGLDHLLIDEAQDTAPAQWQILQALTAEFLAGESARRLPRTIFAVGDVKQSIFSFQGAEPRAFLQSRTHYGERVLAAGGDWRPLAMQTSFRSTRAVLAAVDATFASKEMREAIALEDTEIVHRAWRKLDGGSVEVWPPLHVRDRAKPPPAWEPPTQRSGEDAPQSRLARLIARRIEAMLARREPLLSQGRPIRAGDIMVLVRRRTQLVPALIRALKDLKVPVAGIDRMLLTEQLAVMDLLALVQFVLLPEDDLTLATVLKSPLVGFDEDALYALAQPRHGSLWQALRQAPPAATIRWPKLRTYLTGLRADADLLPPYEFLMRALGPLPGAAEGIPAGSLPTAAGGGCWRGSAATPTIRSPSCSKRRSPSNGPTRPRCRDSSPGCNTPTSRSPAIPRPAPPMRCG